jgi:hypothetical protein
MICSRKTLIALAAATAASLSTAGPSTVSGVYGDITWSATSTLTGVTNTQSGGPIANGGDPIYWPSYPARSGAVHLLMDYGPAIGQFICSGTLLSDRRSILTAAHCVSDGAGTANPLSTTVYFQPAGGLSPGTRIQTGGIANGGAVTRQVTQYFVNGQYSGDVIDHNDIAVLRLDADAPIHATGHDLYTDTDLGGRDFTATGYGRLGDGATGANNFAARLREGDNTYDFRLGDSLFGSNWASVLGEPFSQIEHSWVSDFDNGLALNDTSCIIASNAALAGAAGAAFCDLGVGAREVGVAGGDSGGGDFIGDRIASVNSYGLTFGTAFGDSLAGLNSSFGEFSGYVPVYLHADFINRAMATVPTPQTLALTLAGLLALGATTGRRKTAA